MSAKPASPVVTRKVIYFAMVLLLLVIFIGAYGQAPPVFLAVAFIGEIILVSTAHLSSMIQQNGLYMPSDRLKP